MYGQGAGENGMNGADREMRWRDQRIYMRRKPERGDRCVGREARGKGLKD